MSKTIAIAVKGAYDDPFTSSYRSGTSPFVDDDLHLVHALQRQGVSVVPVPWDDAVAPWDTFQLVLIRSPWGFFFHTERFLAWLDRLERASVPLYNPAAVVRGNMSKRYLIDLERGGATIVPTEVVARTVATDAGAQHARSVIGARGWHEVVLKPASLGGAYNIHRLVANQAEAIGAHAAAILAEDDLIMQEFFPEIGIGELSLVFFEGVFSHAVRKVPAAGDWREQKMYGGTVERYFPSPTLVDQAQGAIQILAPEALYARVDGMERGGTLYINEVELIDPRLFFEFAPGAAERMSDVLLARCL